KGKQLGYCTRQIAVLMGSIEINVEVNELAMAERGSWEFLNIQTNIFTIIKKNEELLFNSSEIAGLKPVYKRVDTCAAEFESYTPYLYSTQETECEAEVSDKNKVIILGGGPNRIGQGIEFDYCCCHASFALQEMGIESIMVNSNPETVSTDYDTSDRLYFEPLTLENILNIVEVESKSGKVLGVILQFGGQTPLRLAEGLHKAGVPILGTSYESINLAEDRELFSNMINKLSLKQPHGTMATSLDEAFKAAEEIGYPILVRPSYVLGGRAMSIVHTPDQLREYMQKTTEISANRPALIDQFLMDATELDVDALCDSKDVFIAGIMEHIEEAGVHSGDSACILPPRGVSDKMMNEIKEATRKIALELKVIGLLNIQYAIYKDELYLIEVNPRASRTVPFVAKATGISLAKEATRVMSGIPVRELGIKENLNPPLYYIKEVVLPFKKFSGVDTMLGPEMKSTGEVMGIGKTPAEAFYKAQTASGGHLPLEGTIFISVSDSTKELFVESLLRASKTGYKILATKNTAAFMKNKGIEVETVNKVHEGSGNIVDKIKSGGVDLLINIPTDVVTRNDAFGIRLAALQHNIPYTTTVSAANCALEGMVEMQDVDVQVYPL
ncbi:MAG: carbamoyl-phosphate synthase large subunit, partial [Leptospirales bacterium]